ncbi:MULTISPECIES: SET domain-containing protein [unclassified Paraflavitalea]|uniref:SET domain-containing protein n=1 Tax=unclassified Paraflavitalea TaxID=2798305 RepID=UPI003D34DD64
MVLPCLYIGPTENMGRGVFTDEDLALGTIIEIAPVIVMSAADREHLDKTLLHDYIFIWNPPSGQCCMALGYVPIYNHSYEANCLYEMDYDDETIKVTVVKEVKAGEQLFINYNGDPDEKEPVWFHKEGS